MSVFAAGNVRQSIVTEFVDTFDSMAASSLDVDDMDESAKSQSEDTSAAEPLEQGDTGEVTPNSDIENMENLGMPAPENNNDENDRTSNDGDYSLDPDWMRVGCGCPQNGTSLDR